MDEITPRELHARIQQGESFTLIDVREPWEHEYAALPGSELRPLGDIYEWARELDPAGHYVFYCHTGMRSAHACRLLKQLGFQHVLNLRSGIDGWSTQVDAAVPRY